MKYLSKRKLAKSVVSLITGLFMTAFPTLNAAGDWDSSEDGQYITVYQHCGFKGGSKRLSKGKYRHIKDEGIPNDAISSIRIPAGMSATVYKHTKFKGPSQNLNNSVQCLGGKWNDEISSLKVYENSGWGDSGNEWGNTGNAWGPQGGNNCTSYRVSTSNGEGGFRITQDPSSFQSVRGGGVSGQICRRGSVQVELSKTNRQTGVLLEVQGRQYRFNPGDGGDKFLNNWHRKYYTIPLN